MRAWAQTYNQKTREGCGCPKFLGGRAQTLTLLNMRARFSGSMNCYRCLALNIFRQGKWLLGNRPRLREHSWISSSETATALLSFLEIRKSPCKPHRSQGQNFLTFIYCRFVKLCPDNSVQTVLPNERGFQRLIDGNGLGETAGKRKNWRKHGVCALAWLCFL